MNLVQLPNDLFLLIVAYLSPKDLILNRRVSKQYYSAFTESELSRHLLLQHFPRVRELRDPGALSWAEVFSKVTSRYHYLKAGKPRGIETFVIAKSRLAPEWSSYYPVGQWQRELAFEGKRARFHYAETLWTYDNGKIIYPSLALSCYVLYDLSTGQHHEIDIESTGKIVRRLRLGSGVLIVEWCERDAYHQLNETEEVHRHFATAYDILDDEEDGKIEAIFRNEWNIHFLGLPLNSRDRFYTTHTDTHYAMYLWQPNRSSWGEDEPLEALAVWDITSPSSYRPSQDPTGKAKPSEDYTGPRVIRRFSFSDLAFYRVRQRSSPTLRSLELDENHVYVVQEDHRWIVGQEESQAPPRLHKVKSTGIPFTSGPCWEDECGADGDVNLSFCQRDTEGQGPRQAPCWRHEEFPYLTISKVQDAEAGVTFSARHCFMLETISISIKPKIHMTGPGYEISLKDDFWNQLLEKGQLCGDERWLIGENIKSEIVILHFDREVI